MCSATVKPPQGAWDTTHMLMIPALSHEADGQTIFRYLDSLPGIKEVQVEVSRSSLQVTYDQTRMDYATLVDQLASIGFPVKQGWFSRKRGDWFQYLDSTARANANLPPPPCCSNPKGLNGGKSKK